MDLQLLGRQGCSLCDEAREVLAAATARAGVPFREVDVDSDPELRAEWGDLVPALLIDGVCFGYYVLDADRLDAALQR